MFTGIVIGVLSASALIQQTDTVVALNGATRLELDNLRGEVVVRVWDRDAVQITADHRDSRSVSIQRSGRTLSVEVEIERGMGLSGEVNFHLNVPRSLDLSLEGMALDVDVQGTEGQVRISTVHGPIRLQGGRGSIVLESVSGRVEVEGAQGRLEISGAAGDMVIRNSSGELVGESVGGSVEMEGVSFRDVDVGTVGGSLRFQGAIVDGGRYNFGSHGGQIWLYLPANLNARVEAVSLAGNIEVDYPGAPSEPTRGHGIPGLSEKELTFELGTASARIEAETFAGTIHILRQGGEL